MNRTYKNILVYLSAGLIGLNIIVLVFFYFAIAISASTSSLAENFTGFHGFSKYLVLSISAISGIAAAIYALKKILPKLKGMKDLLLYVTTAVLILATYYIFPRPFVYVT